MGAELGRKKAAHGKSKNGSETRRKEVYEFFGQDCQLYIYYRARQGEFVAPK